MLWFNIFKALFDSIFRCLKMSECLSNIKYFHKSHKAFRHCVNISSNMEKNVLKNCTLCKNALKHDIGITTKIVQTCFKQDVTIFWTFCKHFYNFGVNMSSDRVFTSLPTFCKQIFKFYEVNIGFNILKTCLKTWCKQKCKHGANTSSNRG